MTLPQHIIDKLDRIKAMGEKPNVSFNMLEQCYIFEHGGKEKKFYTDETFYSYLDEVLKGK